MTLADILERKHISARRNLFFLNDLKGGLFYIYVNNPRRENSVWDMDTNLSPNSSSNSINGSLVYLGREHGERKRMGEMFLPIENIEYNDGHLVSNDLLFKLKKISPFTVQESPILYGNAARYDFLTGKKEKWKKINFKITDAKYLMRKGDLII